MRQLTISEFLLNIQRKKKTLQHSYKDRVDNIVSWKSKIQRLKIQNWLYTSYEIETDKDQKIKTIKFIFLRWQEEKKFKIQVQSYQIKEIKETYWLEYIIIKDLLLWSISEKTKVWYKEAKNKINYFNYLWLEYNSVQNFIKDILLNYHQNK